MRPLDAVEHAALEWVDGHNSRQLLQPIGNTPPAEAEAAYYAMMENQAVTTSLKPKSFMGYRGGQG